MPLPVWIALIVVLVSLTAGATYVFLRLLSLWRALKHFNSALNPSVGRAERPARAARGQLGGFRVGCAEARGEPRSPASLARPRRGAGAPLSQDVHATRSAASPRSTRASEGVAAVDLGTNTTRLLVADVDDGRVEEIAVRARITGLGEGVDARRKLLPLPIARVRNALTDYRRELESLGAERVLAVATSAVRDADNGEAFLGEVEWSYGFTTQASERRRGGGGSRCAASATSQRTRSCSTSAAARPS